MSLFADDMILHIENSKVSIKTLLELINEFSKVAGYKINIQKSVTFLYTNNKLSEKEFKKRIPFTITTKRIKYIEINFTKEGKDLYSENYKTLMKKTDDSTINGKISHVHGLDELILLKCPYYQKQSTDLMQSLSKYPGHFS